jgi:hypothetical protein
MKTIKTAAGNKRIEPCSEAVAIVKIKEILHDHRSALIARLIADLATYVNYRFGEKPSKDQVQLITEKLYIMKNQPVDIDKYDSVVNEILGNVNTHLSGEPFYKEIDELISWQMRPNQMVLVQ